MINTISICGQKFTPAIVDKINQIVEQTKELTRRKLSIKVCELLNWRDCQGKLKAMSCRVALLRLKGRGLIELPAARNSAVRTNKAVAVEELPRPVEIECSLEQLGPICLEAVSRQQPERLRVWNGLIEQYHYLGNSALVGAQMRYLIVSEAGVLGALGFSASAWRLEARDRWIGWDQEQREVHLQKVVNNARFLILPSVRVPNLGSKVLSMGARQLGADWQQRYGYEPVLVETFVEHKRFAGTSYRAANWQYLGLTKGRGKKDVKHEHKGSLKAIYVYPLRKDFRESLGGKEGLWEAPAKLSWAEQEFESIQLGDERRHKRLHRLSCDFYARPEANIPQACGSVAATKGAYRFFAHKQVSMPKIVGAHSEATVERCREKAVILAVQDTTVLNYSGHEQAEDLGEIGTRVGKTKGMIVHDTMAFDTEGLALGLLDVQSWIRDLKKPKKGQRKKRPIQEKESYRWLCSYDAVVQAQKQDPRKLWVSVGDREADIYELFAHAQKQGEEGPKLLVRATHNRILKEEQKKLWESMQEQEVAGTLQVEVPRKPGQKKRRANLQIRHKELLLHEPSKGKQTVRVWAVYAHENNPPKGSTALSWMLLTTVPVNSFAEAVERVRWYTIRWQIEVYHKVLKSGCRTEDRQLKSRQQLEACLALDMVVAWRIFYLTHRSRHEPQKPCSVNFEEYEWKALYFFVNRTNQVPQKAPPLRQAVRMVAQLGGFLGRKCDGEPGPKTLWRGLQRLKDIANCYKMITSGELSANSNQLTYGAG